jgi:hypothetical protein
VTAGLSLGLGAVFCIAIGVLSRVWLPYDDTGLSDAAAIDHLGATLATLFSYALASGYAALCATRSRVAGAFGTLVVSSWLGIVAMVGTLLFIATYAGLPYRWFWTGQVLLYVLLAVVWAATAFVSPAAQARESQAELVGHRKARIATQLQELAISWRSHSAGEAAVFVRALEALAEEVRFFPAQATGADVAPLFSELTRWAATADAVTQDDHSVAQLQELSRQAAMLRRQISQWKRA